MSSAPAAQPDERPAPRAHGHPVQAAIHAAIARLAGFRPARIVGEPDENDARALIDDLLALAAIVDPVVAAVGEYAVSALGMPRAELKEFEHQLRGALEGNATFCLESTMRERVTSAAADSAERRVGLRRG